MDFLLARDFFAEATLAGLASMFFDVTDVAGTLAVIMLDKDVTVKEAALVLGKDRSTAQRALRSLVVNGLAKRKRVPTGKGGARFVYSTVPRRILEQKMKNRITYWTEEAKEKVERGLRTS